LWSAFQVARYYGAGHRVLTVPPDLLAGSTLTGADGPTAGAPTVVPGRNLLLVSLAVTEAISEGAGVVRFAAHDGDHAVYPDCRATFVEPLSEATTAAYGVGVSAPFLRMSRREVVALGRELAVPFDLTWSCYDPQGLDEHRSLLGPFGRPCGVCGACLSRAEALA
jgi:7-cyano-7-deazaguanine synthase